MAGDTIRTPNKIPDDVMQAFKNKASFMKTWKPASNPSNRDRLELYSLHKQAVSGDAVPGVIDLSTPAEKAKYNAWKSKSGLDATEAMRRYCTECDRQIQTYGTAPSVISSTMIPNTSSNNNTLTDSRSLNKTATNQASMTAQSSSGNATANGSTNPNGSNNTAYQAATATAAATTLRGLAAIPLLCAAASEDRQAYLKRLHHTPTTTISWWRRQEPLTATPSSFAALPEHLLLTVASFIEYLSLAVNKLDNNNSSSDNDTMLLGDASPAEDSDELLSDNTYGGRSFLAALMPPAAVLQSFLWPTHNCLLAVWIEIILLHAVITGAFDCFWTVLWGSRNTGKTLSTVWNQHVRLAAIQSVNTITDYHQPVAARCVGLLLWPATLLVQTISIITIDVDNYNGMEDDPATTTPGGTNINFNTAAPAYYSNPGAQNTPLLNANIWTCLLFSTAVTMTWWYWIAVIPWITMISLIVIFWVAGSCFALIELAGV